MAPIADVDPLNLAEAGWGVIFAPGVAPAIHEALSPLLELRRNQAGKYFRIYEYQAGQTKRDFLAAHGAGPGLADPGIVPYYILLVASPDLIPFRFQLELDVQYAVGRIWFDRPDEFANYARSVVRAESAPRPLLPRRVALFGVASQDDMATQRLLRDLDEPLAGILTANRDSWGVETYFGVRATKAQLGQLLGGDETPALLFATSQGLAHFEEIRQQQRAEQGAIVCQDWPGPSISGPIAPAWYFSGRDVTDSAHPFGIIAVLLASYSAGTPEIDQHQMPLLSAPRRLAEAPFIAELPLRLLSHPNGGALGIVGSLDRGWIVESDLEVFERMIKTLLDGYPLGFAMEYLNQRQAEIAVEMSGLWADRERGVAYKADFAKMFHQAARAFLLLGDPAVRIVQHSSGTARSEVASESVSGPPSSLANSAVTNSPSFHSEMGSPPDLIPPVTILGELPGAVNDQVATDDQLGALSYTWALVDLIESRDTQPPLTIGIFGSWGMGKSFLLKHLQQIISARARLREQVPSEDALRKIPRIHVVDFKAWEYYASDSIWPAFARKVLDELEKEIWRTFERYFLRLHRNVRRQFLQDGSWLLVLGVTLIFILAARLFLPHGQFSKFVGPILGLSGLGALVKLLYDVNHRTLGRWITNLFEGRSYGRPIDIIDQIRADMQLVDKRLKRNGERALILIDDLDRCEPGKVIEMLQATRMLLDFESFVVCIGVDVRIASRAVERHYQGLLGEVGASGYEYLDKLIQIPFQLPTPSSRDVGIFLSGLMGDPLPPVFPARGVEAAATTVEDARRAAPVLPLPRRPEPLPPPRAGERSRDSRADSPAISFSFRELSAFRQFGQFLRPNPRHLKRLLNVYRLVRSVARYKNEQAILGNPEAIVCWIVVCYQWPYTAHLMMHEHEHLLSLALSRDDDESPAFPQERPLEHLLRTVRDKVDPERQRRLDQDREMLDRLVTSHPAIRLTWEELGGIRRCTSNFNPVIDIDA